MDFLIKNVNEELGSRLKYHIPEGVELLSLGPRIQTVKASHQSAVVTVMFSALGYVTL